MVWKKSGVEKQTPKYARYLNESLKWHLTPLPDDKILDWSNLKQITDHILKCI